MKLTTLYMLALGLLLTGSASAQIGIGVQAGVLSSGSVIDRIENDNEEEIDTDNITGFTIGIPVEIAISNVFSLQPEINYLRRGYDIPADLERGVLENQTTYDVLEVPVLGKLGYTTENFTIAATFGPSFQYLLAGQVEVPEIDAGPIMFDGGEIDVDFDDPIFEDLDRGNIYGIVGLQLVLPIGFGKFLIDGRYRFALSDEEQGATFTGADDTVTLNIRDRGLSLTAGIMVTLGDY